jgi:hypothetical protein
MKYSTDQIEAHYASSSAPLRSDHEPLTIVEHLLFALVSLITGGLAVSFWIYFGMKGKRKVVIAVRRVLPSLGCFGRSGKFAWLAGNGNHRVP